jgi:hypothetical protein
MNIKKITKYLPIGNLSHLREDQYEKQSRFPTLKTIGHVAYTMVPCMVALGLGISYVTKALDSGIASPREQRAYYQKVDSLEQRYNHLWNEILSSVKSGEFPPEEQIKAVRMTNSVNDSTLIISRPPYDHNWYHRKKRLEVLSSNIDRLEEIMEYMENE